jgi:diacylglycerol O-acyltransferase
MMAAAQRLGVLDTFFLYADTAATPMHVGALLPFAPPPGGTGPFLRGLRDELRHGVPVAPPWNRKLATPWLRHNPLQSWVEVPDVDLDYHVRRSALPAPGDERELGIMLARLHSNPMDLGKPPWELHFIEGLAADRFAVYIKIHHALVDGFTGMKLLVRSLSTDPDDTDMPLFFAVPPRVGGPRTDGPAGRGPRIDPAALIRTTWDGATSAVDLTRALARLVTGPGELRDLVGSLQAPRSVLNRRISRNRRFATQQYSLPRLKELAASAGATVNDVVLTLCGGGLRTFLAERDALPDAPLVAFVPVNVRPKGDEGGGNAVGAMLASLGTHLDDPAERLAHVTRSTRLAKRQLAGMDQKTMLAYSAALLSPAAVQTLGAFTGMPTPLPLTFNTIVSNVPGPPHPMYLRGARLEAMYPLSIPVHSVALNITVESYADTLNFGFIGCRDTLPHLQNLAVYTGDALERLSGALPAARG